MTRWEKDMFTYHIDESEERGEGGGGRHACLLLLSTGKRK